MIDFNDLDLGYSEYQRLQTTLTQIEADAQRQEMNRWKILEYTQTKCFGNCKSSKETR